MSKLLTIGMSTYDDFDGVYFTIQSLLLYHNILKNIDYEILIIDNNPNSGHGKKVKDLIGWISDGRYIPYKEKNGTSVRNEIFKQSLGKYTLCLDCHVLLKTGGLESLLNYYLANTNCQDIVQGPMLYDDQKNYATHFDPVWRQHMYGVWGADHKGFASSKPFEISMMGLGVFSCETKNWLGFNNHFKGFGGEEGYIHEKFRMAGGKAICLPQLQWLHRFVRPMGVPYLLKIEDKIWNYFVGWLELTQDPDHQMIKDIYNHFVESAGENLVDQIFLKAKTIYSMD